MPARLEIVVGLAIPRLRDGVELARLRLRWFGRWNGGGSIPLALCTEGCLLRRQALAALDRAGMAWHLCVAANSVGVVEAAIASGMAVGPLLEAAASEALPLLDELADAIRQRVAACTPANPVARTSISSDRGLRGQNRTPGTRRRAER